MLLDAIQDRYFNFQHFVLLDPYIGRDSPDKDHSTQIALRHIYTKRDTWSSRAAAKKDLMGKGGYKYWTSEAVDLFVVRCTCRRRDSD